MRFSVLTTLLAASSAVAAPVASPDAPSTSSATGLIKNLNPELEQSAANIKATLDKVTDKTDAAKQVNAEFQKMTQSIQSVSSKFEGVKDLSSVLRRDGGILTVDVNGKPVVPLPAISKRDGGILTVDVNGKPVVPLPAISKRAAPSTYIEVDLTKRDGGILTVDVNGKPVVPLPAISKRAEDHIEIDFDGKPVLELPPKGLSHEKRDDKEDLSQELKKAVDTVSGAAQTANEKLGAALIKEQTVPAFAALNGLSGSVVSLLQL